MMTTLLTCLLACSISYALSLTTVAAKHKLACDKISGKLADSLIRNRELKNDIKRLKALARIARARRSLKV